MGKAQSDSTRKSAAWGGLNWHMDPQLSLGSGVSYQTTRSWLLNFEIGFDIKKTGCISRISEPTRYIIWAGIKNGKRHKTGISKNWLVHFKFLDHRHFIQKNPAFETGVGVL